MWKYEDIKNKVKQWIIVIHKPYLPRAQSRGEKKRDIQNGCNVTVCFHPWTKGLYNLCAVNICFSGWPLVKKAHFALLKESLFPCSLSHFQIIYRSFVSCLPLPRCDAYLFCDAFVLVFCLHDLLLRIFSFNFLYGFFHRLIQCCATGVSRHWCNVSRTQVCRGKIQ